MKTSKRNNNPQKSFMADRQDTDLMMICTSDIAGQLRGKAIPMRDLNKRASIGVGWTPTNIMITSFGSIAPSPWGAFGDLMLVPDFDTHVNLKDDMTGIDENFVLGDILTLDNTPWDCCLRSQLKLALRKLKEKFQIDIKVAFEHEFMYMPSSDSPVNPLFKGYQLNAFRELQDFPNHLMHALTLAGIDIDTFMPEFGQNQCEVTIKPQEALKAADQAIILREITKSTALKKGFRASFCAIPTPESVGNGVHVHFSLYDAKSGNPICYDNQKTNHISDKAGAFASGILSNLPEFVALTASSIPSYIRLTPHRWSAAYNNLGIQDREAALRVCPVFGNNNSADIAKSFHFEFRAADAISSPYLVLLAIINAGMSGLKDNSPTPKPTNKDLSLFSEKELTALQIRKLPGDLNDALDLFEKSNFAKNCINTHLFNTFLNHKRYEANLFEGKDMQDICNSYQSVF